MDMTSGKIHKEDGNGGWLPYGFGLLGEESCTKTLQKFYVNCIFLPLQTARRLTVSADVVRSADDMQFPGETDLLCRLECSGRHFCGFFKKTVEKTEKSKKMNGIFLKTVIR